MPAATDTLPPLSTAINRAWLPRLSLAGCVRAGMWRDTRGAALTPGQRFNHFPATPLCSLCWWFSGQSESLARGAPAALDSPRTMVCSGVMLAGPHTGPSVSWNPGPGHGMMLMLQPDALHHLTGLDPNTWLDTLVDATSVLPADWLAMCREVEQAAAQDDPDACFAIAEAFLAQRWQAARQQQPAAPARQRYLDWAQDLALRAASTGPARSLRQIERRIKQWTGQPLRELRVVGRAEQAFFDALDAQGQGQIDWPDIAAQNGYADQSHLSRVTRRMTGFPPAELARRIESDEGFWAYRLWR